MKRFISAEWLARQGACKTQVKAFSEEWPNGARITKENLLRAADLRMCVSWLLEETSSDAAKEAYWSAERAAYEGLTRELSGGCSDAIEAEMLAAYYRTCALAFWNAYQEDLKRGR